MAWCCTALQLWVVGEPARSFGPGAVGRGSRRWCCGVVQHCFLKLPSGMVPPAIGMLARGRAAATTPGSGERNLMHQLRFGSSTVARRYHQRLSERGSHPRQPSLQSTENELPMPVEEAPDTIECLHNVVHEPCSTTAVAVVVTLPGSTKCVRRSACHRPQAGAAVPVYSSLPNHTNKK